jgi:chromate transport protein ChrA
VRGFVSGATAAAAGAIAGAAIVIGRQTVHGWLSAVIGVAALGLLLQKWKKIPEPGLVVAAALVGIAGPVASGLLAALAYAAAARLHGALQVDAVAGA